MEEEQNEHQLSIELSEEIADGIYSNLAIITHSTSEFVIDFVNVMPGTPKSRVKSRIILTPQHAKRFMKAMIENIDRFEEVNALKRSMRGRVHHRGNGAGRGGDLGFFRISGCVAAPAEG